MENLRNSKMKIQYTVIFMSIALVGLLGLGLGLIFILLTLINWAY